MVTYFTTYLGTIAIFVRFKHDDESQPRLNSCNISSENDIKAMEHLGELAKKNWAWVRTHSSLFRIMFIIYAMTTAIFSKFLLV